MIKEGMKKPPLSRVLTGFGHVQGKKKKPKKKKAMVKKKKKK